MTKFPFVENAWAICEVCKANPGIDMDTAYQMFKADVIHGSSYNTKLIDIDFATMKSEWDALGEDGQNDARVSWNGFYYANFKAMEAARRNNDKKAFQAIVDKA